MLTSRAVAGLPYLAPFVFASLAGAAESPSGLSTAFVKHELARGSADPRQVEKLGRIQAKTLLLWGEKDSMFSKADQDGLLAAIPGSRLIPYANTGHALHWEYPERFAKDLSAFAAK